VASGVVEPAGGGFRLGDQVGVLEPANVEALAGLVADRLPGGTSALVVGDTRLDALLGFIIARARALPLALMYDHEGIGNIHGVLPKGARACLITGLLQDSWRIDEFQGLCRQHDVEPGGVVALVSSVAVRDGRVNAVLEL
jgi:hypothetical protein